MFSGVLDARLEEFLSAKRFLWKFDLVLPLLSIDTNISDVIVDLFLLPFFLVDWLWLRFQNCVVLIYPWAGSCYYES